MKESEQKVLTMIEHQDSASYIEQLRAPAPQATFSDHSSVFSKSDRPQPREFKPEAQYKRAPNPDPKKGPLAYPKPAER